MALESFDKLKDRIENVVVDQDKINELMDAHPDLDERYPEIRKMESMDRKTLAEFYRDLSGSVKESPEKFQEHLEAGNLDAEELAELLGKAAEYVEKYPEIEESKDKTQMLHPSNLSILKDALKANMTDMFKR